MPTAFTSKARTDGQTWEEPLTPLAAAARLQLIAYQLAVALGRDVDKPRNLAKSR